MPKAGRKEAPFPNKQSKMNCSICFDEINKATGSTILSCQHVFHFRCIDSWFTKQINDDLPQTCPCCRNEGVEADRCSVISAGEEEEQDDDETYAEDGVEHEDEDADSILDEIPNDIHDLMWERVGEGRWMITSRTDLAYQGLRGLFGEANELDSDPAPVAATKIQSLYRGHKTRETFRAALALTVLMN